jgi:hypothetical protein
MAFRKRFCLSDESINTYGFWIKLSGMDLSGIQKNCPLYYEHRTWELPCGHVENIELKEGKVYGDIVIEGGNEIEREYIRKIENGDIKGCSFGIDPTEWSDSSEVLKQGQTRSTLTKCCPYEVSLAPLPGNKNALALKHKNDLITLAAEGKYDFIPGLNTQSNNMKEIAILLGMAETASEQTICAAVQALQSRAFYVDAMQKVIEDAVTADLPAEAKAFFVELSKTNMPGALQFLNLQKAAAPADAAAPVSTVVTKEVKLTDLIKKPEGAVGLAAEGKNTFDYLQRHNTVELSRIRKDEPEKYDALVAEYSNGVRYTGKGK